MRDEPAGNQQTGGEAAPELFPSMQDNDEAVRLLREMRHDLAKLTKISEKAARRNKAYFDYLDKTKLSRRFAIGLLVAIVILMLIQVLQMAGYGPGTGSDGSETLQRIHTVG